MPDDKEVEYIVIVGEEAPVRIVAPTNRASNQMVANFLNVTRKFTVTLEYIHKQELMQSRSKVSLKSLDFDSIQAPFRASRQEFTPPRMPAQSNNAGSVKLTASMLQVKILYTL
jgi:hypothetical protein